MFSSATMKSLIVGATIGSESSPNRANHLPFFAISRPEMIISGSRRAITVLTASPNTHRQRLPPTWIETLSDANISASAANLVCMCTSKCELGK